MLQYLSDLPRQAVHCKWLREQFDARVQDTIMNDRVLGVATDEQDLDAGMAAACLVRKLTGGLFFLADEGQ